MLVNLLPDSRMREPKGTVKAEWLRWGKIELEPVWCANCGVLHGYVPQETTTFACWLCNACAEQYGESLQGYVMPDEVFWRRVHDETGGQLSFQKLQAMADATWGALSKLLREQPKRRV